MKEYVAGFFVCRQYQEVLLISKNRPDWQAGKLNAIGGKIEPGESALVAMQREANEEAGLDIEMNWKKFCVLTGFDWTVHFFVFESPCPLEGLYEQKTDEKLQLVYIPDLWRWPTMHNLPWLIPMSLCPPPSSFTGYYVREDYGLS